MSSQELIILASCISCSISSILVILILVYYLNTNQGKPEDTQGKPEDTQGKPEDTQGKPEDTQGKPDGVSALTVFCVGSADWGNQKTTAGKTISRDCPGGEKITQLCKSDGNWANVGTCKSIENGKCALNEDCKDFTLVGPGLACDNGTCKKKVKDSLGIFYKPSECKGPCFDTGAGNLETTCTANAEWGNQKTTAGNKISRVCPGGETVTALCKGDGNWADVGTCKSIENGKCNVNEDCKDFTLIGPGLACDNGTCKKKVKDWFGIFYKPSECKGPCNQTS